ncbi:MAG: mechanosensitive ion channel family protein [Polyangiales bacterium]
MRERTWMRWAQRIEDVVGTSPETQLNLLHTLVVLVAYLLLRKGLRRSVLRQIEEPERRYRASKAISYVSGVVAVVLLAKIWLLGRVQLSTYLGILSAGLAVALQDPITNLAGWLFIAWRQPFKVGDRVQLGAHTGDIVDVRLFMFTMLEVGNWVDADQSTGRILHLPNGQIFRETCANYTDGFQYVWNEIPVTVTFESDWERAHQLLTDIVSHEAEALVKRAAEQVDRVADEYKVSYTHLTPIVWLQVDAIGVTLTLRYLCGARHRRTSADRLWRAILKAFADEPRIDFAYPTRRMYNATIEGKEAMRPAS